MSKRQESMVDKTSYILSKKEIELASRLIDEKASLVKQMFDLSIDEIKKFITDSSSEQNLLFKAIVLMKENWAKSIAELDKIQTKHWLDVEMWVAIKVAISEKLTKLEVPLIEEKLDEIYFHIILSEFTNKEIGRIKELNRSLFFWFNDKEFDVLASITPEEFDLIKKLKTKFDSNSSSFISGKESIRFFLYRIQLNTDLLDNFRLYLKEKKEKDLLKVIDLLVIDSIKKYELSNKWTIGNGFQDILEKLEKRNKTVSESVDDILSNNK